jgi:hypothetical protein
LVVGYQTRAVPAAERQLELQRRHHAEGAAKRRFARVCLGQPEPALEEGTTGGCEVRDPLDVLDPAEQSSRRNHQQIYERMSDSSAVPIVVNPREHHQQSTHRSVQPVLLAHYPGALLRLPSAVQPR